MPSQKIIVLEKESFYSILDTMINILKTRFSEESLQ